MIQTLEPRIPTAVASFAIDMPTTAIVGEQITATITATEHDPYRYGLRSASIVATWDDALLQLVDARVTDDLPLWQTNDASAGRVELSGTAWLSGGDGRAIGNIEPETFATLEFLVIAQGPATVELEAGSDPNITVPSMVLQGEHLRFESATVLVGICRAADWADYSWEVVA